MNDRMRLLMGDQAKRMSDTVLLEFANDAINEVYTRTATYAIGFVGGTASWAKFVAGESSKTSTDAQLQLARKVLSVNRHTTSGSGEQELKGGYPLEEVSFSEIMQLITNETTQGAPTKYHLMLRHDTTDLTNSGSITFYLFVHPICDGDYYFSVRFTTMPTFLTSLTSGSVALFGRVAPELAARIAAARAARVLGQPPEFVDNLWASVEEGYAKLDADLKNRWKVAVPA